MSIIESLPTTKSYTLYESAIDSLPDKPIPMARGPPTFGGVLSNAGIIRHMRCGNIVISPFDERCLSTSSYDVTLGPYYYKQMKPRFCTPSNVLFNPYYAHEVVRVWGSPQIAKTWKELFDVWDRDYDEFPPDTQVIILRPGETILAHTNEFIGGRGIITTMMKARSSMGRSFIEVCKCAGWGDIGYINRWTMEITNNSRYYNVCLVVGERIAQIVFFETEGTIKDTTYEQKGKYQTISINRPLTDIKQNWRPEQMLPKLYMDQRIKTQKM